MTDCRIAVLGDRALLRVTGGDARAFLQGLITNDIDKVTEATALHAGLLTPQGKILFDFFVLRHGDGYLLDVAKSQSEGLRQRLNFYRLRAEVGIEEEQALEVAAAWGGAEPGSLPQGSAIFVDPRLASMGWRILLPAGAELGRLGCAAADAAAYHAHRIVEGVPEGGRDYAFGDAFPHEAMFDQLRGVDFAKGCFIGQEVVSRMQHRGTARKRIVHVEGTAALPEPGTEILAGTVPIGTLGSVSGERGLGLVRLDRAEEAKARGEALSAGGIPVTLRVPDWARLQIPAVAAS